MTPFQSISRATSERGMDVKTDCRRQSLALVLISMERSLSFAYRLKRKLLIGPICGGAYMPSAVDYGTLVSSNVDYLTDLLNDKRINWKDLP